MATSISSGVINSDTLVFNGKTRVNALTILTDGTNAATVDLKNGTTTAGAIKITGKCIGANLINHILFDNPVLFETGLYVDVTGTGATCIIYYGG
jgi:hypothetical protein